MNLLEELEILLETRQQYTRGEAGKCYPLVAELIEKLRAEEQAPLGEGEQVRSLSDWTKSGWDKTKYPKG